MMKVYLDGGLNDRLETVIGEFIMEDERYLTLNDNSIKRRIPHSRIVHIEDLSKVIEEVESFYSPPSEKTATFSPPKAVTQVTEERSRAQPLPERAIIPGQKPLNMAELRQALSRKDKQAKKEQKTVSNATEPTGETTFINVIVSGAHVETVSMEIPAKSFVADQYSASLATELAKDPKIKTLFEKGIIFDGKPAVVGKNIYLKTKTLGDKVSGISENMELVGKLHEAGQKFMQPDKHYSTDFSMSLKDERSLPAIPHSPFDGPVLIRDIEPINTEVEIPKIEEETGELNESSPEEAGISEEKTGRIIP